MTRTKLTEIWVLLVSSTFSIWVGLMNRFPLVYTDTGTYIHSGFSGTVPSGRPIFYGLFLRYISMASSLYLVIFVQGLIVSWLLLLTLKMFFEGFKLHAIFLASVVGVSLFTAYSHTVSILIPDIFSAIGFLAFLNLAFNPNLTTWNKVTLVLLLVASIAMHFSNLPIMILLVGLVVPIRLFNKGKHWVLKGRTSIIIGSFVGSIVLIPSVNYLYSNSFTISQGSHIFLFNHLVECGVIQEYLSNKCETSKLKICEYQDDLNQGFLWKSEGAFKELGRFSGNVDEYKLINRDVLTSAKYWPVLIQKTFEYTFKQFFTFQAGIDVPQRKGSAPYSQIHWRFHDALYEYTMSRQYAGTLKTDMVNMVQPIVIIGSLMFLLLISVYPLQLVGQDELLKKVIFFVLLYMLASAMVCSNLSTVNPRYQARIVWILPIMATVAAFRMREKQTELLDK